MHAAIPFCVRVVAEPLNRDFSHARHDPHAEDDINGIGNFEADLGKRRIRRSHDVGDDEHRATAHRAFQQAMKFCVSFCWLSPIICRSSLLFRRCADESELLDPRDVVRIRSMQIGTRDLFLVELEQHTSLHGLIEKKLIFTIGTVAPENVFRVGERSDFVHPIEHRLVVRLCIADSVRREYGGRNIFHEQDAIFTTGKNGNVSFAA